MILVRATRAPEGVESRTDPGSRAPAPRHTRRASARAWVLPLITGGLIAAAAVGRPASAQRARSPVVYPVDIENAPALRSFHEALRRLAREPARRVRIAHWGDSNVAADLWTAVAREELQRRYGDGGSGYLLPARVGSWHRGHVRLSTNGRWAPRRRGFLREFGPSDGLWGVAGVAMEPRRPGATVQIAIPEAGVERTFELHALGRPRPGRLALRLDDGPWEQVSTRREHPQLLVIRRSLDGGPHLLRVRHGGGVPRVLGLVVERRAGIIYDVLGINGHRASALLSWNDGLLRQQLAGRPPDLVVLSYGGNEALDRHLSMSAYEAQTGAAIDRMRGLAPLASCLLVGPLATYERHAARMSAVTRIQRRLARQQGCAFWDSSRTSGGPGTLRRWARFPGMVSADHLHLGRSGYEAVGRGFASALLRDL